jgi:lipoprotein-anchoring transpeptidase ErfK/SrfK
MALKAIALRGSRPLGWLSSAPTYAKVVAVIVAVTLLLAAVGVGVWSYVTSNESATKYAHEKQALATQLQTARQQGYTSQDLAPVTTQLNALNRKQVPWFLPSRPGYYQSSLTETVYLEKRLTTLEQQLLDQARGGTTQQMAAAQAATAQAQQAQAADPDIQSLQQRTDATNKALGAAINIRDYRAALQQSQSIMTDATTLANQTVAENAQVDQAAQQLVVQTGGNIDSLHKAGGDATSSGRNDASVAAYLNKSAPFAGFDSLQRAYSRMEKFAAIVGSGDVNQAARGTAGSQRYGGQVHTAMIAGLPAKAVIVSFQAQHLWAYQSGQVGMETAVTTGIRGVTDYGTDFGPMKVVRKNHPWKMQSPWPHGSPLYYPDTVVQWATFFTETGESIHDAYWESDSRLGPGSQYDSSTRSHGCIHVPFGDAQWMYNFADVGMYVVVYPGDGSPESNQLSLMTTDAQGKPQSQ